jgi:hypothetical protein
MARHGWKQKSVGIARQTDFLTENTTGGSFTWMYAEVSIPEETQAIFDVMAKANAIGTHYAPAVGARTAKMSLKFTSYGLKRGYDPETQEPGVTSGVIPGTSLLIGLAMGSLSPDVTSDAEFLQGFGLSRCDFTSSKGATFGNADVGAVTSASLFDVGAGNGGDYTPGQLFVCGSSKADTACSVSWIKTIATDTITLADACANTPVIGDDTFGTWVACLTNAQPVPFTLILTGSEATDKVAYIGCQVDSWKCTVKDSEVEQWELEISAAGVKAYNTGGGLQALSVLPQLPRPLIGNAGGRVTIGVDGSAMVAVTVGEVVIEGANEAARVGSIGAMNGTAERINIDRVVKITVKWPRSTTDTITNGEFPWQTYMTNGTPVSLALYSGATVGTGSAWRMPALHQSEPPKLIDEGGLKYDQLTLRPEQYTGDTGSTPPANAPIARGGW